MKLPLFVLVCCGIMLIQPQLAAKDSAASESVSKQISRAEQLELKGDFTGAASTLRKATSNEDLSEADRRKIAFEIDRLNRIRRDFPLSRTELFAELQRSVKDLDEAEFERWIKEGRFDSRMIDGERKFMSSSVSNLFFRYPELESRRVPAKDPRELEMARWQTISAIKAAARSSGQPYVLPKRLEATMTVTAKPGSVDEGELVRAWLPVPRAYPFHTGFRILESNPEIKNLAPETATIRSAYMERQAKSQAPASFSITYQYTAHGVSFDLDPTRARKPRLNPDLKPFIQEAPHVVFTPEMRALAQKIAGSETNILRRAKRYYDWIGENIKYSYAIEYSTIRNISDYCRSRGYGDCGQEALLFITLCRMDGIPARWQSGWNLFPGAKSIHDWSEIYIEPYGWFPVDPYMSIFAARYVQHLTPSQKRELRDFYFGGLDQYRMAANSDHCQTLMPLKEAFRSDTVDFQRGEIEASGRNLYFDRFSFDLQLREIVP